MKFTFYKAGGAEHENCRQCFRTKRNESGMAVIVILALVAIMLIYIAANLRTLSALHRDINLMETKQVRRLAANVRSAPAVQPQGATTQTNSVTPQPKP
jgi:hypothetical protein